MSRILIWSPNYAPELTGIPPLVTDAAEWLAGRGNDVAVVTAVPSYPQRSIQDPYRHTLWMTERRGPVTVDRSWLRVRPEETFVDKVLHELTFTALSLPHAARRLRTCDVLVCVVPSLGASVAAAALVCAAAAVRRRPRLVLWVHDLVVAAAGSVNAAGRAADPLLAAARRAELFAARAADLVVVCSPGFQGYFERRGVDPARVVTVPNWVDVGQHVESAVKRRGDRTRFLYAGNVGYTQGFETLFEAARRVAEHIDIGVVGDGNAARRVRELATLLDNVEVAPPVPAAAFPGLLAAADGHLVLQRRVSAGVNLPSKIGSYLASGRPIVAAIDATTPAADVLRRSGGAILAQPEDPAGLANAMLQLHAAPALRVTLGRRGREYAARELDRTRVLPRFEQAVLG